MGRGFPNVTPVNVAIHATRKTVEIHRADPARAHQLSEWAQGIGSVNPTHHLCAGIPADAMLVETVECMTLEDLLREHHVTDVDLLQIDTEGYDAEVIRMIDFDRHKPAIIHFEHGMPSGIMTPAQFKDCASLLIDNGYNIVTEYFDAVAYRPEIL